LWLRGSLFYRISKKGYLMKTKDFTRPEYSNPVIDMWEFFEENPQFRLLNYEHINGGVRVIYVVVS